MKNKKTIIIVVAVLVILVGIFLVDKIITSNVIKSEIPDNDWLKENCNCTERLNLKCPERFELQEDVRMCKK